MNHSARRAARRNKAHRHAATAAASARAATLTDNFALLTGARIDAPGRSP